MFLPFGQLGAVIRSKPLPEARNIFFPSPNRAEKFHPQRPRSCEHDRRGEHPVAHLQRKVPERDRTDAAPAGNVPRIVQARRLERLVDKPIAVDGIVAREGPNEIVNDCCQIFQFAMTAGDDLRHRTRHHCVLDSCHQPKEGIFRRPVERKVRLIRVPDISARWCTNSLLHVEFVPSLEALPQRMPGRTRLHFHEGNVMD